MTYFEWFLPGVLPDVSAEDGGGCEGFAAVDTLVGPLSTVHLEEVRK